MGEVGFLGGMSKTLEMYAKSNKTPAGLPKVWKSASTQNSTTKEEVRIFWSINGACDVAGLKSFNCWSCHKGKENSKTKLEKEDGMSASVDWWIHIIYEWLPLLIIGVKLQLLML